MLPSLARTAFPLTPSLNVHPPVRPSSARVSCAHDGAAASAAIDTSTAVLLNTIDRLLACLSRLRPPPSSLLPVLRHVPEQLALQPHAEGQVLVQQCAVHLLRPLDPRRRVHAHFVLLAQLAEDVVLLEQLAGVFTQKWQSFAHESQC